MSFSAGHCFEGDLSPVPTVLSWFGTQPIVAPGSVAHPWPASPVTPRAVPLHLAPGVPQPHQLHLLAFEQGLGQRDTALKLKQVWKDGHLTWSEG